MANQNILGVGVSVLLSAEAVRVFQSVLPPLYGGEMTEEDVMRAVRFTVIYLIIFSMITGILTDSVFPILLPAIALGIVTLYYKMESRKDKGVTDA